MAPSIQLRPLTFDDWPTVHEWAQMDEACRYQAWGPNTPEQTREFIRTAAEAWNTPAQQRFPYAIVFDRNVVGTAELKVHGSRQGEISYGVHPDHWGRGIGVEAARQLLAMGFREHGLHRIFGTCDPRNIASGRVLQKIGMSYEGRLRETILVRDGWRDSAVYAILEHEWSGATPAFG